MPYEKFADGSVKCIADKVPFALPQGWAWARLKELFNVCSSRRVLQSDWKDKGIPFYRAREIVKLSDEGFVDNELFISEKHFLSLSRDYGVPQTGDLMVSSVGTIGKVYIVKQTDRFYYKDASVLCFENRNRVVISDFARILLESSLVQKQMKNNSKGTTVDTITISAAMNYLCLVPPINEQIHIVDKVKKAFLYVDEVGKSEKDLQKILSTIKSKVLDHAIRGQLVPQNSNDEPASVLLERIREEKSKLITEGKIKKDKHESIIFRCGNSHYEKVDGKERCIDNDIPFEIPESWAWVRWGTLSESIQYGYNAPAQEHGRIKMVRISDIQNNTVSWDTVPYCDINESDIDTYLLKPNDILFARTGGTVGKSYLVQEVPVETIYAGYLIRTRYSKQLCPQYLKYFMESELYWAQLKEGTIATAQPNCNGKTLGNMLVPIPPLSEQQRIVEKVRKLLNILNAL